MVGNGAVKVPRSGSRRWSGDQERQGLGQRQEHALGWKEGWTVAEWSLVCSGLQLRSVKP